MSKVKVRLSFKEFNLEVEGSRDDLPQISQNLTRQLTGFVVPATTPIDANILPPAVNGHDKPSTSPASGRKSSGKGRKSTSKEEKHVNWTYDGQLYGIPSQNWSGNDKAIWILYVADKVMDIKQMGSAQITNTFNEHYKAAKTIHRGNVYSGLDKLRLRENSPVGKTDDGYFFLTQEGYRWAEELIADLQKPQETA